MAAKPESSVIKRLRDSGVCPVTHWRRFDDTIDGVSIKAWGPNLKWRKRMITWRRFINLSLGGLLTAVILTGLHPAHAREPSVPPGSRTEIEVQLTESFYQALRVQDGKTYSTGRSDEYLRQIAVASKFMVETNLRVIENQRRIIQLLESMQKPTGGVKPN